jgi:hypothetical protein
MELRVCVFECEIAVFLIIVSTLAEFHGMSAADQMFLVVFCGHIEPLLWLVGCCVCEWENGCGHAAFSHKQLPSDDAVGDSMDQIHSKPIHSNISYQHSNMEWSCATYAVPSTMLSHVCSSPTN